MLVWSSFVTVVEVQACFCIQKLCTKRHAWNGSRGCGASTANTVLQSIGIGIYKQGQGHAPLLLLFPKLLFDRGGRWG